VSPRVWLIGAPILIAFFVWRPSPLLIVMAILSLPQVIKAFRFDPKAPENAAYYSASPQAKIVYGTFYLGLAAFLAIMSYDVSKLLNPT
jgi:hypothetical protein